MRAGFVEFVNTAPIMIPWRESGPLEGWDAVEAPPTLLNRLLFEGEIDAGTVSSYEYGLHSGDYLLLPDLGISATGPVGSVILLSRDPLSGLGSGTVSLTPHSATSVNLLRIILGHFMKVHPHYIVGSFSDVSSGKSQAYLAIGDEALRLREFCNDLFITDLADMWHRETGLPFVFAVWAVRRKSWELNPDGVISLWKRLISCRQTGEKELSRVARETARLVPMDEKACLSYLEGIEFDLSERKREALLEFFRMLFEMGGFPRIRDLGMVPTDDRKG